MSIIGIAIAAAVAWPIVLLLLSGPASEPIPRPAPKPKRAPAHGPRIFDDPDNWFSEAAHYQMVDRRMNEHQADRRYFGEF